MPLDNFSKMSKKLNLNPDEYLKNMWGSKETIHLTTPLLEMFIMKYQNWPIANFGDNKKN